jgi:hypothetical protein
MARADGIPTLVLQLTADEREAVERAHQESVAGARQTLDEWAREVLLASLTRFPIHLPNRLRDMERAAIEAALVLTGANQVRAAALLGISRRGLIAKLEKLGLKPRPSRRGTRRRMRGRFTATFKRSAVRKVVEAAQPIEQVARDLDVPELLLRAWVKGARAK